MSARPGFFENMTLKKEIKYGDIDLLKKEIQRGKVQREKQQAMPELFDHMPLLRQWQSDRLSRSYGDLLHDPRYRQAAEFFLSDLYGEDYFSSRDDDVERLILATARVVPDYLIHTVTLAAEMNALTAELDFHLLDVLIRDIKIDNRITDEDYAQAYRICDNYVLREYQINLTMTLGQELDHVVSKPFIYEIVRMLKIPAIISGFSKPQSFLERGFKAFLDMQGADEFLNIIKEREMQILDRIFAAHPQPFAVLQE